jgi:hypothetical protein
MTDIMEAAANDKRKITEQKISRILNMVYTYYFSGIEEPDYAGRHTMVRNCVRSLYWVEHRAEIFDQ